MDFLFYRLPRITVNRLKFYLLISFVVFSISCKKDEEAPKPQDLTARTAAIEDYKKNYLGSGVTLAELNWTGDTTDCKAGTVSDLSHQRVTQRLNYFRRATGLSDNIITDLDLNRKCQEAALMCYANQDIDHYPPTTWKCYTEDGAEACGKSNLSYGYYSPSDALTGTMVDRNTPSLGHRRWLLYSELGNIGHGSAESATVIRVDTKSGKTSGFPEYTSWPPKGYVMAPLVFNQWSFSVPGWEADFSKAKIEMFDSNGSAIQLDIIQETLDTSNGYMGDNTIGWVPANINKSSTQDVTYKVKVSNVITNGKTSSYEYNVTIVQP